MRLKTLIVGIAFVGIFAWTAIAQTGGPPPAGSGKIGLINTSMFGDEKAGIIKFKNAQAAVDKAMEPANAELRTLGTRYNTGVTEYQNMQKNPAIKPDALRAKEAELQNLQTTLKRKQEDAKAQFNKVHSDTMSPIINDIIKALNEYAKQKGYAVILDGTKLEQADLIWGFDDRYDVTKDFIAFYNARPAGTASATPPK